MGYEHVGLLGEPQRPLRREVFTPPPPSPPLVGQRGDRGSEGSDGSREQHHFSPHSTHDVEGPPEAPHGSLLTHATPPPAPASRVSTPVTPSGTAALDATCVAIQGEQLTLVRRCVRALRRVEMTLGRIMGCLRAIEAQQVVTNTQQLQFHTGMMEGKSVKHELAPTTHQYMEIKQNNHNTSDKQMNDHFRMGKDTPFMDTNNLSQVFKLEQEVREECTRSICLLEQKRKVVSSNIDVPQARKWEDEVDMDKVTAAMVLTSLSTSPLVRSPPMRLTDVNGSWKEVGFVPSSASSSGSRSWNSPSDCSNPSTPSPPLYTDSFKHFRPVVHPDDIIENTEANSLLFDEPVPRKRKNSMKVMFKCLWKTCGKVLSTAAGIKKHIRTIHLGHIEESEENKGEEDFYYTEIRLNPDSVTEGLNSLSPFSPPLHSPPSALLFSDTGSSEALCAKTETKLNTPISRSAPSTLCLVHPDHVYQATLPVKIPGSNKFNSNGNNISVSWIPSPVTFIGTSVSLPCYTETEEQRQPIQTALSSPPRAGAGLRKPRGEGKKCRKVYGMENRDKWCTACRWKKACQRFPD
ncbi:zinc finger protein 704 [Rhinophrynus dorsalis]